MLVAGAHITITGGAGAGTNYLAEFVEKANHVLTTQLRNFLEAVEAGVKIAFGTDIGVCSFSRASWPTSAGLI